MLDKFILTRLIKSSKKAILASLINPDPRNKPEATSGGNIATATITPIKAVESLVSKANVPAIPEIIANAKSEGLICALFANSFEDSISKI